MKQKIIIAILLISCFIIGIYLGIMINARGNNYQAGWDAAKKRLAESGLLPVVGSSEIKSIYGEIKKIEGNNITVKIKPLEPLADPNLDERTIVIAADTKIYQLKTMSQAEYKKEIEAYAKEIQENAKSPTPAPRSSFVPPQFYEKKITTMADIKVGQQITATAAENIKEVKEIKAIEIVLRTTSPLK